MIVNRGALPRGPDYGRQAKAVLRVGVEEVARIAFRRRPRGLGREKVLPGQQPAQRGLGELDEFTIPKPLPGYRLKLPGQSGDGSGDGYGR